MLLTEQNYNHSWINLNISKINVLVNYINLNICKIIFHVNYINLSNRADTIQG